MTKASRRAVLVQGGIVAIIAAACVAWLFSFRPGPSPGASPPALAATAEVETTVYVTNTGKKYHRAGCRHLKSSIPMPLSRASKQYEPCKVCSPPR